MADAAGGAADAVANLHVDDVTGEKISKSELKRRQKARAIEKKKSEKAATAPVKDDKGVPLKAEKKGAAEDDESNLTPSVSSPPLCPPTANTPPAIFRDPKRPCQETERVSRSQSLSPQVPDQRRPPRFPQQI